MVISLQLNVTELELAVVDQGVGLILKQVSFSICELRQKYFQILFKT